MQKETPLKHLTFHVLVVHVNCSADCSEQPTVLSGPCHDGFQTALHLQIAEPWY